MPPRKQKILDELKAWCDEERGRANGSVLGVTTQAITDWFGKRRQPTAEQILAAQEFLAQ